MARFARDADALCDEMDTKYALAERVLAPLTAMGAADSFQPTDREEIPMGNWIELSLTKLAGRAPAGPAQRIWLNLDCAGYMMGDANGSTNIFRCRDHQNARAGQCERSSSRDIRKSEARAGMKRRALKDADQ